MTLLMPGRFVLADMLLVVGVALVTTSLLMVYVKRRRRRRAADRLTPTEKIERMRQQRGMRGDLEDLMVEIEQLSRRFGAQLDAKSIQLEQLLSEADQRIQQLSGLSNRDATTEPWSTGQPGAVNPQDAAAPLDPTAASDWPRADNALVKSVYALADQGLEPEEIAQKLDEMVGKVELILALRNA